VIAILSDIHANMEALSVVLAECEKLGVTQYLCLGDVIGYGPDPVPVARIASARFAVSLLGNHEEALVTGKHRFNPHAAQAIDWTRQQIKGASDGTALWDWFTARKSFAVKGRLLMVHGSIYDPVHDYVDEPENPIEAQQMIDTLNKDFSGFDICFAGHNHTPFMATTVGIMVPHDGHHSFRMPKGHKAYVCVGSVGQPRDRDVRASFATLDGEQLTFHRVPYDLRATQAKIRTHGLNEFLAERLAEGI
jgi:predicted phosphodiesterase